MGRKKVTKRNKVLAYKKKNPSKNVSAVAKAVGVSYSYAWKTINNKHTGAVKEVASKKSPRFRTNILATAERVVSKDRESEHGDASANFKTISGLWSSYLGYYVPVEYIPVMLMLLKVARTRENPSNIDNYVDMCGYASLAAEYSNENKY